MRKERKERTRGGEEQGEEWISLGGALHGKRPTPPLPSCSGSAAPHD